MLSVHLLQFVEEARFKAGEAEVEVVPVSEPDRELVAVAVAVVGGAGDGGSSGEAEAQHPGTLVEGFACGVVEGFAEEVHFVVGGYGVEGRVPSGGDQGHERRLQRRVGEVRGCDVSLQMVYGDEG